MRIVPVTLTVGLLSGAAWLLLAPPPGGGARSDQEGPSARATPGPEPLPVDEPTVGKLVIRVRTSDGTPVPAETKAGYLRPGERRMRKAAPDGTFPFADAPVGRLDVTAEAPGYDAAPVPVTLVPGVDSGEAVVVLTPVR